MDKATYTQIKHMNIEKMDGYRVKAITRSNEIVAFLHHLATVEYPITDDVDALFDKEILKIAAHCEFYEVDYHDFDPPKCDFCQAGDLKIFYRITQYGLGWLHYAEMG